MGVGGFGCWVGVGGREGRAGPALGGRQQGRAWQTDGSWFGVLAADSGRKLVESGKGGGGQIGGHYRAAPTETINVIATLIPLGGRPRDPAPYPLLSDRTTDNKINCKFLTRTTSGSLVGRT